jgi:hypothetical protein
VIGIITFSRENDGSPFAWPRRAEMTIIIKTVGGVFGGAWAWRARAGSEWHRECACADWVRWVILSFHRVCYTLLVMVDCGCGIVRGDVLWRFAAGR